MNNFLKSNKKSFYVCPHILIVNAAIHRRHPQDTVELAGSFRAKMTLVIV